MIGVARLKCFTSRARRAIMAATQRSTRLSIRVREMANDLRIVGTPEAHRATLISVVMAASFESMTPGACFRSAR
jgi:hypothetical protein